uniref:Putative cdk5 activator-binding protein n=1 Tax=Lutzomyia longipalpis TaxID=7200 RepID=A0A7G3AEP5_LUTLO
MDEQDIPIDIHTGKLLEWLVSRRVVGKEWHKAIPDIRNKINNAIRDMPANEELVQLLSGAHINYFHCLKIVEILKMTEADTKNVFGRYGSQRMKDWQEVVKNYEKDSVYLAEAAQILVRNITFEIPSLKKQITKFEQLSEEAAKKAKDMSKSQNAIRGEFTVLCQQLGIKGEEIKAELKVKLEQLPQMFGEIAAKVSALDKAVNLYGEYCKNKNCLQIIRHVSTAGNSTVYEFLYSEAPLSIEEPKLILEMTMGIPSNDNQEIDFGDGANIDFGDAGAIDFGESDITLQSGNEIDWGDGIEAVTDPAEINFDISLEESGIVVEGGGQSGGVARGEEALSILDAPTYRDRFIDELLELEAFLKMRLYELTTTSESSMLSMTFLDEIAGQDTNTIQQMIVNVEVVLANTLQPQLQYLHQVKHSPRYIDILSAKVRQKLTAIDKLKENEKLSKEKSVRYLEEAAKLRPDLEKAIKHTKTLQQQIESDISKRYKNRTEQDIPIDIHTGKLLEWLVSRRVVGKEWHKAIPDIRNKINNAIRDMPANEELVQLLSGAHINYFHCLKIVEILKMTEADTKNVFGRYGSQRMKDWQEVVKNYEKDSVYLAEAAQILVRNITFEIPSLKKQITKFEQLSEEAAKKAKDMSKSQNAIRGEFTVLCQQLGIKGEEIKAELKVKLEQLPQMFGEIAAKVSALDKAVNLYGEYCKNKNCLQIIRHVSTAGNSTVYEFLYSEAPLSIEEPQIDFGDDDGNPSSNDHEIDFGDGANIDFGDAGAIDFGESDITLQSGNEIDWGDGVEAVTDPAEINFDISLEESGIVVEGGGQSGGVARGEEALSILDAPTYRDRFIDELLELEAFLKMRLYELTTTSESSMLSMTFLDEIAGQDTNTIQQMIVNVEVVLANTLQPQLQYLHQVKHSPRYIDILSAKVRQKLTAIDKLKENEKLSKEKSVRYLEEAAKLRPDLEKAIKHTKTLQQQIESDISKRYKNRTVNLMGGQDPCWLIVEVFAEIVEVSAEIVEEPAWGLASSGRILHSHRQSPHIRAARDCPL